MKIKNKSEQVLSKYKRMGQESKTESSNDTQDSSLLTLLNPTIYLYFYFLLTYIFILLFLKPRGDLEQ